MKHEETKSFDNGMFIYTQDGEYFLSVMADEIETYKISSFQYFNARDLTSRNIDEYLDRLLGFCRYYEDFKKK